MCSAVFVTGLDPAFAAENVGYFTAPYAERAKLGTPRIDRDRAHRPGDDAQRHGRGRAAGRQPGVRHAADRQDRRVLHAVDREERAAGSEDTAVADGRRRCRTAICRRASTTARLQQAVEAAFDPAGHDRGVRRHVQGADHRRALRRAHHADHAARELVDGQEPERHADGHPHQAGRLRRSGSRRRFPNGRRRATRARRSASPTSSTCRAGSASARRRIRTSTRRGRIPITSTCTRAASTPSSTRRRVRCSGRRTPSDATATPIRCSPTT